MELNELFGKHHLQPGNLKIFDLESFALGIKREKEGWFVETADGTEREKKLTEKITAGGEYFQTGKPNSVVIAPALPGKPLVFKGSQLHISSGRRLSFFLKIPMTLQIYASKPLPESLMKEIPSKRLSDTWFGEPDNGEAAFAFGSEYFLDFDTLQTSPLEAVCPVTVINNSPATLEIQRLIIRVENLTLYKNQEKKVTSVMQVEFKGQDVPVSAEYRYSKIYNGENQEIIAKPRNTSGKNLLKMNFHFIKNIYKTE